MLQEFMQPPRLPNIKHSHATSVEPTADDVEHWMIRNTRRIIAVSVELIKLFERV